MKECDILGGQNIL